MRAYLRRFPVTEGKKALLRLTRRLVAPADPDQVAATKHGFRLRVSLANPEQERIYYYGEHDERYETALLKRLLAPGMSCWDVGANIGFYTCLFAAAVGDTGKVVAFEPASATRERLLHNVGLNGFGRVTVEDCAVGAAHGEARIHYGERDLLEGTASLLEGPGRAGSETVAVRTLDELVERHGPPDFLKIDVEGSQLDAWRGGERFFACAQPLVMAELRDSDDPAVLAAIEAAVRRHGFALYTIHKHARVAVAPGLRPGGPRNYMLAKPGSAGDARLRQRLRHP